jgi:ER lumen protein retaining receptor
MDMELWLFTLGNLFQLFANCILLYKLYKNSSMFGLSIDSQQLFFIALVARCIWIYDTRLISFPLAAFELLSNLLISGLICVICYRRKATANATVPVYIQTVCITLICGVICFFFHPGAKNAYYMTVQMLVSFSMYMESFGLVPQIYIIRKLNEVENLTKHYIMAMIMARFIRFGFWFILWNNNESFLHLVMADLLHTVFLSDFALLYIRSWRSGKSILLR